MVDRGASVGSFGARRRLQRLGRAPPFSSFPREILRELAAEATGRTARRGTVLFRVGDGAASAYVVDRGVVRISAVTRDGRSIVFRLAGPGDTFGLTSLFDDGLRTAEAAALTDARVIVVPSRLLLRHVERSPTVASACLRESAARLRIERDRRADGLAGDTRARVARVLRDLGAAHGVDVRDGVLIDVPLRHEDLAGLVGSSRETVTRALAVLEARGFLRRTGEGFVVLSPPRLSSVPTG